VSDSAALLARLRAIAAPGPLAQAVAVDGWQDRGLARGRLHEVYADDAGDVGAAAGFAVAQALAAGATPLLWLRLDRGGTAAGRLHATGLAELGLAPDQLLLVTVADPGALLRAAGDVARCAGVGTLLVESWGPMPALDLTATRRLVLAAEASGVTVVSLRLDAAPVPSAAATRWQIAARPSVPLEAEAPGLPAFAVECLRRRGGPAGVRTQVEWNRETRSFRVPEGDEPRTTSAPLAGAGVPLAAGGAVALDPAAPVRASG